jgi:hypothetical protein
LIGLPAIAITLARSGQQGWARIGVENPARLHAMDAERERVPRIVLGRSRLNPQEQSWKSMPINPL